MCLNLGNMDSKHTMPGLQSAFCRLNKSLTIVTFWVRFVLMQKPPAFFIILTSRKYRYWWQDAFPSILPLNEVLTCSYTPLLSKCISILLILIVLARQPQRKLLYLGMLITYFATIKDWTVEEENPYHRGWLFSARCCSRMTTCSTLQSCGYDNDQNSPVQRLYQHNH